MLLFTAIIVLLTGSTIQCFVFFVEERHLSTEPQLPRRLTSYACLANLDMAAQIAPVCSVFHILRGLYYLLNPAGAGKAIHTSDAENRLTKWLGLSLITYGWNSFLLTRSRKVTAIFDSLHRHKLVLYAWIALAVTAVGTLII